MEKIFRADKKLYQKGYATSPEMQTAYLFDLKLKNGEILKAVSLEREITGEWHPALAMNYYLTVNGQKTVITFVFKLLGGRGSIYDIATARFKEHKPDILIETDAENERSGDITTDFWRELGVDIIAINPGGLPGILSLLQSTTTAKLPEVLCSNLEVSSSSAAIKPYIIKTVRGTKLGIFSVISDKTPVTLNDAKLIPPARAIEAVMPRILDENPDAIILIANMTDEELADALHGQGKIGIVINGLPRNDRYINAVKTELTLSNTKKERYAPLFETGTPNNAIAEIELDFVRKEEITEPVALRRRLISGEGTTGNRFYDDDNDEFSKTADWSSSYVLPDKRFVYDKQLEKKSFIYMPQDIYNLAAAAIRRETGAEVAFVNIKPYPIPLGNISSALLKKHLGGSKVSVVKLRGGDLMSLLPDIERKRPVLSLRGLDPGKYTLQTWLAASGMDGSGRISGFPVRPDEVYTVALPGELLARADKFPALKRFIDKSDTGLTLGEMTVAGLLKMKKEMPVIVSSCTAKTAVEEAGFSKDFIKELRRMVQARPDEKPVWRLNIDNLSFQFSNTTVSNADKLSGIPSPRLMASDQIFTQGAGRLASEYYDRKFSMITSFAATYGKIILKPRNGSRIENETADQWLAENEARFKLWQWNHFAGGGLIGPFASVGYDTEFSASNGVPLKRIWRGKSGVKLFDGRILKDFYVAAVVDRDYTFAPSNYTKWAYQTGFKLAVPLYGGAVN